MNLIRNLTAIAAVLAIGSPAAASVTFNVSGGFWWPGVIVSGSISGTFTTNDAITQLTAIHLTTTENGDFESALYDDIADVDENVLPHHFRLTVPPEFPGDPSNQLQLVFSTALTSVPGAAFTFGGFESQPEGGNRMLNGTASVVGSPPAAVPEPASWALTIVGFGLVGAVIRRRRLSPGAYRLS